MRTSEKEHIGRTKEKPPSVHPSLLDHSSCVIVKVRTHRSLVQVSLSRYHRRRLSWSWLRSKGMQSGLSRSPEGIDGEVECSGVL
jgi:hypothetical protein